MLTKKLAISTALVLLIVTPLVYFTDILASIPYLGTIPNNRPGVVVSTILAIGQARARVEADNARAEAQLIADFLENDVLGSAEKARVGEATVSYILNAASESLQGKFKDKPLIEASIRLKLGYTWRQIGESDEAEQHFLRVIDIYKQHYGEEHLTTLNTMDYLGYIYEDQGRYRDMERLWTRILKIRQRVYGVEYPAGTTKISSQKDASQSAKTGHKGQSIELL